MEDPVKKTIEYCTKSTVARCGRCGGTSCSKRTDCQFFQCRKSDPTQIMNETFLGTCADCESEPARYIAKSGVKLCGGVHNKDHQPDRCASNEMEYNFCKVPKIESAFGYCTEDTLAACGKCDRVKCDDD